MNIQNKIIFFYAFTFLFISSFPLAYTACKEGDELPQHQAEQQAQVGAELAHPHAHHHDPSSHSHGPAHSPAAQAEAVAEALPCRQSLPVAEAISPSNAASTAALRKAEAALAPIYREVVSVLTPLISRDLAGLVLKYFDSAPLKPKGNHPAAQWMLHAYLGAMQGRIVVIDWRHRSGAKGDLRALTTALSSFIQIQKALGALQEDTEFIDHSPTGDDLIAGFLLPHYTFEGRFQPNDHIFFILEEGSTFQVPENIRNHCPQAGSFNVLRIDEIRAFVADLDAYTASFKPEEPVVQELYGEAVPGGKLLNSFLGKDQAALRFDRAAFVFDIRCLAEGEALVQRGHSFQVIKDLFAIGNHDSFDGSTDFRHHVFNMEDPHKLLPSYVMPERLSRCEGLIKAYASWRQKEKHLFVLAPTDNLDALPEELRKGLVHFPSYVILTPERLDQFLTEARKIRARLMIEREGSDARERRQEALSWERATSVSAQLKRTADDAAGAVVDVGHGVRMVVGDAGLGLAHLAHLAREAAAQSSHVTATHVAAARGWFSSAASSVGSWLSSSSSSSAGASCSSSSASLCSAGCMALPAAPGGPRPLPVAAPVVAPVVSSSSASASSPAASSSSSQPQLQ